MITRILGLINRVLDDCIRLQVGPLEYELLISDAARASLASRVGQEVSLFTRHYLEGGAMQSSIYPRLIGFETELDLAFFDLFCTVDKIGIRKALRALSRPVHHIAESIRLGDEKALSSLPGIGKTTAQKIISTLQKKMLPFCAESGEPGRPAPADPILNEVLHSLMQLGMTQYEARARVEVLAASGQKFETIDEALHIAFRRA